MLSFASKRAVKTCINPEEFLRVTISSTESTFQQLNAQTGGGTGATTVTPHGAFGLRTVAVNRCESQNQKSGYDIFLQYMTIIHKYTQERIFRYM